jgi:YHS domain-containing protein
MLRNLFRLALFIVAALVIRGVVGWAMSAWRKASRPETTGGNALAAHEARRDPVCGMYVSTAVSVKATIEGQEQHFCSAACRDKYLAA